MSLKHFVGAESGTFPDCLIFDVDGVLMDADDSFPEMIRLVVEQEWGKAGFVSDSRGYTSSHNSVLKRHGAFNDDYDIAWMLLNISASRGVRLSLSLPAPEELSEIISSCKDDCTVWLKENFHEMFERSYIRDVCSGIYFGCDDIRGTYALEKPLMQTHWRNLPLPVYIYTGRNEREWRLAQEMLGWGDLPDDRVVHSDSGMYKPSPDGLIFICDNFNHECPVFFGDTASDIKAYRAFGRGWFAAIGPILEEAEHRFSDVNEALSELADLMR